MRAHQEPGLLRQSAAHNNNPGQSQGIALTPPSFQLNSNHAPIQRQGNAPTAIRDRATALQHLRQHFGVRDVRQGTTNDLIYSVHALRNYNRFPNVSRQQVAQLVQNLTIANSSFGSNPQHWQWLVNGFEHFNRVYGGTPNVQDIVLMHQQYELNRDANQNLRLVPKPNEGAFFSGGKMYIFDQVVNNGAGAWWPRGRSNPGTRGHMAPNRTAQQGIEENVVHELGHGMGEALVAASHTTLFTDYNRAVGWINVPQRGLGLYDIGANAVQRAIQNNQAPSRSFQIDASNWNNGNWIEQPISKYQTNDPGEDFAESVSAYANRRSLLQSRSPRRYQFIHSRRAQIRQALRQRT